jgi:hypothetical protein
MQNFGWIFKGKRSFRKPRRSLGDNMKMDFAEVGCGLTHLACDED